MTRRTSIASDTRRTLVSVSDARKARARDLRYGRRGGRWANERSGRADKTLAEIHTARLTALRHDLTLTADEHANPKNRKWPAESIDLWKEIAQNPAHPAHARALEVVELAR